MWVTVVVCDCLWGLCRFATPVELGVNGLEKNLGLGELDEYEQGKLQEAVAELIPSIVEGVNFIANDQ